MGGARVTLSTSVHPVVRTTPDAGRMEPSTQLTNMSLLFRISPQQQAAIDALMFDLQNPASPRYHQWLTPEQYAAQFGASPADVARATAWLRSQGLTVLDVSRTGRRLSFSGTVAQVERALHTEMHHYVVDGVLHFANSSPPSVPSELADLVFGVHNLHDFRPLPPPLAAPKYALPLPGPDGGLQNYPSLGPPDFAKIYGLSGLYAQHLTGTGQHVAIAGQTDFNDADIANFRSTFGLSSTGPTRHLVPNSGNAFVSPNDITEAELDLEWSGAVAQDATIDFVYTGETPRAACSTPWRTPSSRRWLRC